MRIGVITPIRHLTGVESLLNSKGTVFYLEAGSKQETRNFLIKNQIETIICNPNQQSYKIDAELLSGTSVNLINTCSTGMNHIDTNYCKLHGIKIYSLTTDYDLINQLPSTAELAFGLMVSMLRHIPNSMNHVKHHQWDYTKFIGRQIKDLTIGIIGYGRLGKMMFDYCEAFGANVLVYDPYQREHMDDAFLLNHNASIEKMTKMCDVISLHVHVTQETKYMIDFEFLGKCKKKPYIINTSRGEIVNEQDIVIALKQNMISGYAADVLEDEFGNLRESIIIDAMNNGYNIIVTPHTGGMTQEGQEKAYKWAINKL
jgi:D-3-phosphoglycerate dehydrogenase